LQGFKYMYDAGNMPCKKTGTNEWYIMFLKMEKQFWNTYVAQQQLEYTS
jgi:hypothetical protein